MDAPAGIDTVKRLGLFARRPATTAAALLMVGIVLHAILPDEPKAWLVTAGIAGLGTFLLNRFAIVSTAILAIALMLLGAGAAQIEHFGYPADHIVTYTADRSQLAELEMLIDAPPRVSTSSSPAGRPIPPRQVTTGVVTRVKTWSGWQDCSGQILLSLHPPLPQLAYGQRVQVTGMLARPAPAMNPGQFDWAEYYRDQRILVSIDAPQAENVRILAQGGFAPLQWLRQKARAALERGFSPKQSVDHALLRALLLGDGDPELRDVQRDFIRTGTSHHLSISGMHVAVLGGVIFLLCRMLRLSPRRSAIVMMLFVVLYGLVALPAPPVVRSIILCLAFGIGVILRRSVDGVQLLALTVFIMLIVHPLDLYNAGFQLSFGTVLGLMVYASRLMKRLDRQDEDERVLMSLGIAPSRMQSIRNWLKRVLIEGIATGLVAWAVSAPLIVEHFDQVNPWSIAAGMILAIPVFLSMIGGLAKIILTLFLPWFSPLWAWLAALPVEVMRLTVTWLAKVPGSDVPLPALPIFIILIYYALLFSPLIPTASIKWRIAFRAGAVTACSLALFTPLLVRLFPASHPGELRITLLAVGAGQCAVVQTPSGKTILIDAGSSSINDLEQKCLEPFLRHQGINHIDSAYISHANFDHFSAVAQTAQVYELREVFVTPQFAEHAKKNYPARLMLKALAAAKTHVATLSEGQSITLDAGCNLQALWPPADKPLDANNSCQVLKLTYAGKSILFPGDIQSPAQNGLLADADQLKSDILIAPHHGSAEETTARFLEAIGASTILASNDRTLSGKQREFNKLIQDQTLMRTHQCGAITVRIARDGKISVSTFRPIRAPD